MRSNPVREMMGRRALGAMAAGVVVLVGAPVLAMGVMSGWGPAVTGASRGSAEVGHVERASLVDVGIERGARILGTDALVPTPGSAVLAGLGVLVAVARRRQ